MAKELSIGQGEELNNGMALRSNLIMLLRDFISDSDNNTPTLATSIS